MDILVISNKCAVSGLLSNDGFTCSAVGMDAIRDIKKECVKLGVYVTYWNDDTVTFVSIYKHTVKVPAKVSKNMDVFKEWTIDRINHFYNTDKKRALF